MTISFRCRIPGGECVMFQDLDTSMTLEAFQNIVADKTGIDPPLQAFKIGYPPLDIELPVDRKSVDLSMLGIASNEIIYLTKNAVQEVMNPLSDFGERSANDSAVTTPAVVTHNPLQSISPSAPSAAEFYGMYESADTSGDQDIARAIAMSLEEPKPGPSSQRSNAVLPEEGPVASHEMPDGSFIVRRYVDSDNSCLFTAVGYVMEHNRLKGLDLRKVISDAVLADPFSYSEAVLGKPPWEYCEWINNPQHWGGEIELIVLSQYYKRQIAAFDIKTTKCFIYGEDKGYAERVMLLYDGLHYDPLAVTLSARTSEDLDVTIFNPNTPEGEKIMEGARNLVAKLNTTMQYTDTQGFTIRCGFCGRGFMGEKQAMEHAQQTGHTNFQEYK
ncbi:hypothetical protein BSKO_03654 [Bryopsis sp. KO-2023]|nr:hypothetical protein BSKO_03654 [Bryopsis sp. KO-2023]